MISLEAMAIIVLFLLLSTRCYKWSCMRLLLSSISMLCDPLILRSDKLLSATLLSHSLWQSFLVSFYQSHWCIGIPLAAAIVTRFVLLRFLGPEKYQRRFIDWIAPLSLIGLLFTVIILFASQGHNVVHQIILVLRVAAPLIVYFAIVFLSTLFICRTLKFNYPFTSVQSFTAASNNFELAIAVAIATFGANSNQALAATVGPLIEVPVLLSLVYLMRYLKKRWSWEMENKAVAENDGIGDKDLLPSVPPQV